MANEVLYFCGIYLLGEVLATVCFILISRTYGLQTRIFGSAQWKGHIERMMLYLSFAAQIPQVVIAFGAIKIGAWFMPAKNQDTKPEMDFFLIGNMVSIIFSVLYYVGWQNLPEMLSNCIRL